MVPRRTKTPSSYERTLGRAVSRASHLLEPDEEVEAAAIVQRGLKPLYMVVLMSLGGGLFFPGLTSPESLVVPDAVRWYVGLPLFGASFPTSASLSRANTPAGR